MPRLFTAISLPDEVLNALQRLQPKTTQGIRKSRREQMHVTLHFLGEMNIDDVINALQNVKQYAFDLTLKGIGQFQKRHSRGASTILWAGVQLSPSLMELHRSIADSLSTLGYQQESRPYHPHITLARCNSKGDQSIIEALIEKNGGFVIESIAVDHFTLYSSDLQSDGPIYTVEGSFPLVTA